MTYDANQDAEEATEVARQLHEYAVNELGFSTYDVLFTAHPNGTISANIGPDVAREDVDPEREEENSIHSARTLPQWDTTTENSNTSSVARKQSGKRRYESMESSGSSGSSGTSNPRNQGGRRPYE